MLRQAIDDADKENAPAALQADRESLSMQVAKLRAENECLRANFSRVLKVNCALARNMLKCEQCGHC